MKENKVYTKTGDDGTTGLFSGKRVPKHHTRIKAYGTIDELVAWLGLIRDHITDESLAKTIFKIQNELMRFASLLAIESQKNPPKNIADIKNEEVALVDPTIGEAASESGGGAK